MQVFGVPLAIAIASVAGLAVALFDGGWVDALACLALATPLAATAWAMLVARR